MVRSDSASVLVPTIDLEIPATGQKGEVGSELGVFDISISHIDYRYIDTF